MSKEEGSPGGLEIIRTTSQRMTFLFFFLVFIISEYIFMCFSPEERYFLKLNCLHVVEKIPKECSKI